MVNIFEIKIELDQPVTIGGPIRTVCLPDDSPVGDLVGEEVVVAGWGKLTRLVEDCWSARTFAFFLFRIRLFK